MRRPLLSIRVGRDAVRAELTRNGAPFWERTASYAGDAELRAALAALVTDPALAGQVRAARVELERPLVQLRMLTDVPPVRSAALRALVSHQAARFFRKNGKPLVTNAAWEPRQRGAPRIAAAAAVEEPWLEAIVQGLRDGGLEPATVAPLGSSLELLPASERAARSATTRRRIRGLATMAVALWAVVGALAIGRFARESARIDRELAAVAPAAAAARRVRQEYDAAESMIAAIETARHRRGSVSGQSARILLALPDSAYLMSLHVTDRGSGELTGAAPRGLDVVAALERTQAAAAPRLVGPNTTVTGNGREYERFTLRFGGDSIP